MLKVPLSPATQGPQSRLAVTVVLHKQMLILLLSPGNVCPNQPTFPLLDPFELPHSRYFYIWNLFESKSMSWVLS